MYNIHHSTIFLKKISFLEIFLMSIPKLLEVEVEIQDLFDDLKSDHIDRIVKFCSNLESEEHRHFFAYELSRFPGYRPHQLDTCINLCLKLQENGFFGGMLKPLFLQYALLNTPVIISRLLDLSFYCFEEIDTELNTYKQISSAIFFYKYYPSFSERFRSFDQYYQWFAAERYYLEDLNDFLKYGWKKSSFGYALKYDDVELIRVLSVDDNFDYNTSIYWSLFEWSLSPSSRIAIDIAAHFGSVKAFKYLLINGGTSEKLFISSIAGGSTEIIQMVNNTKINWEISMVAVAQFHRKELVDWILAQHPNTKMNPSTMVRKEYLRTFLIALEKSTYVDQTDDDKKTSLHYSARNGSYNLVDYLIKKGSNIHAIDVLDLVFFLSSQYSWRYPSSFSFKKESSQYYRIVIKTRS